MRLTLLLPLTVRPLDTIQRRHIMSNMKNWMMDIEEFCDGYFFDAPVPNDFSVDEVVEDVGMYFKSNEATKYAKQYLTKIMGEI
jgi:hypothetical protein